MTYIYSINVYLDNILNIFTKKIMDMKTALNVFSDWDQKGRYVFILNDFIKLFPNDNKRTLQAGVNRLLKQGLLERVSRGVYIFKRSHQLDHNVIEHIAKALRRGHYNYLSLESALSEYGAISQIPIDRLTVMTTGRKGEYITPYGVIEFTHTKRHVRDIIKVIKNIQRPLRLATLQTAWRDLKRVGRNTYLVDKSILNEDLNHD
jgi:hypothetical protein